MHMMKKKPVAKSMATDAFAEIAKLTDELQHLVKKGKKEYGQLDATTKKRIVTGLAGATAIVAGAIGVAAVKKARAKK